MEGWPLSPPPPTPVEETHRLTGYLSADQAGWTALALSPPRFRPIAADSTHTHTHTHTRTRAHGAQQPGETQASPILTSAARRGPRSRIHGGTPARPRPPTPSGDARPKATRSRNHPTPTAARQGAVSPGRPNVSEPRAWPKVSEPRARSRAMPHCARPPANGLRRATWLILPASYACLKD